MKIHDLFGLFFNQIGQVPAESGDQGGDAGSEGAPAASVDDTPDFAKPIEGLKPELAGEWEKHRKGMQSAYTKALNKVKDREAEVEQLRGRYQNVDRFYTDEAYAKEIVEKWAQDKGYRLSPSEQAAQAEQQQVPTNIVEAVRKSLPQELQWMAEHIAKGQWAAHQASVGPILDQQKSEVSRRRSEEIDSVLSQLSESDPGWEEHEDEMTELLDFLQSPALTHKVYGSKPKLLLGMLTGNASAIKEATNRMRNAVKHKATGPTPGTGQSNLEDRVRKAGSTHDAWELIKRKNLGESVS